MVRKNKGSGRGRAPLASGGAFSMLSFSSSASPPHKNWIIWHLRTSCSFSRFSISQYNHFSPPTVYAVSGWVWLFPPPSFMGNKRHEFGCHNPSPPGWADSTQDIFHNMGYWQSGLVSVFLAFLSIYLFDGFKPPKTKLRLGVGKWNKKQKQEKKKLER